MDFFYFFFHLSLNILKEHGICSFITTNYYITAFGAKKLRKDFKERAILKNLINFNELKIFESAQGQHNLITILLKGHNEKEKCNIINVHRKGMLDDSFYSIINKEDKETTYSDIIQSDLYETEENYIRLTKEKSNTVLSAILDKIKRNNELLGNISNVNNGVVTGADFLDEKKKIKYNINTDINSGIFIITTDEYNNLNLNLKEKLIVKKIYKNSDIKQYWCNTKNDLWLINLRYTDRPNLNDYPNIKKHLIQYKKILENRPKTGTLESAFNNGMWYVMSTSRRVNMEREKIVYPQRSSLNTFGYNECEWYATSDVFFITEPKKEYKLKYILSLLNSKLYYVWLYNKGKRKGETLELIAKPISEIPIKKADKNIQDKFVNITNQILNITKQEDYLENIDTQNKVKEYKKKIDIMVYKLYDCFLLGTL